MENRVEKSAELGRENLSSTSIDDLRERLKQCSRECSVAEDNLLAAKWELQKALAARAGIAIGDIVQKSGKTYQVASYDIWEFTDPPRVCLYGFRQLKSGGFGTAKRYVGSEWTKVEQSHA